MPFKVSNLPTPVMQNTWWCFSCWQWHLAVAYMAYSHIYVQLFNNKCKESNSFYPVCWLGQFFYQNNVYIVNIFLLWQTFFLWKNNKIVIKAKSRKYGLLGRQTALCFPLRSEIPFRKIPCSSPPPVAVIKWFLYSVVLFASAVFSQVKTAQHGSDLCLEGSAQILLQLLRISSLLRLGLCALLAVTAC